MDIAPELDELGRCPFGQVTGRPCPLCGGTRALVALVRFDVPRALGYNAFVAVVATILLGLGGLRLARLAVVRKQPISEVLTRSRLQARTYVVAARPGVLVPLALAWLWNLGRW